MTEFTKTLVAALRDTSTAPRSNQTWQDRVLECIMCGEKHTILNCPKVDEYTKAGKCRRNHEGKVVLCTGSFVPRGTPGRWLADRIDEWHRQHPNQLATGSLIHTIDSRFVNNQQVVPTASRTNNSTYTLTSKERIATLESEIYNIRQATESPILAVNTRAQKQRTPADPSDEEREVAEARKTIPRIEEVEDVDATPKPKQPAAQIPNTQPIAPEHPYRNARDAAYSPPVNRNVAAKEKYNPAKRPDAAYKTLPPIHDPTIAAKVYNRSMDTPVTLTQRELLSLSPEVRSQVREATTTRRFPNKDGNTAQNYFDMDSEDYDTPPVLTALTEIVPHFAIEHSNHRTPPPGSVIVKDHIEEYYKSLGDGEEPDPNRLLVATESGSIRAVFALIDNAQKTECILDPGCQIIAMAETICHQLGLGYDPSIILNMESANGNLDKSLGLARNVPFKVGPITCYLQVHIIHAPAYDVLLGRPFDILTESIVRNFANEDQTITLHDPNTRKRITIPTLPRTQKPRRCTHYRGKEDF